MPSPGQDAVGPAALRPPHVGDVDAGDPVDVLGDVGDHGRACSRVPHVELEPERGLPPASSISSSASGIVLAIVHSAPPSAW